MVKPDGNIRDHYRYDEFGKPAPGNSKLSSDGVNVNHNSFGYTGEMWDEESELLYLRARYYEPETGRFLSRDSYEGEMANPLSRHLYAYVGNNSVNYVDPTGHFRLQSDWLTNLIGPPTDSNGNIVVKADDNPSVGTMVVLTLVPFSSSVRSLSQGDYEVALKSAGIDTVLYFSGAKLGKFIIKDINKFWDLLARQGIGEIPSIVYGGITWNLEVQQIQLSKDKLVFKMYCILYDDVKLFSLVEDNVRLVIDSKTNYSTIKNRLNEINHFIWTTSGGEFTHLPYNDLGPAKDRVWDNLVNAFHEAMRWFSIGV